MELSPGERLGHYQIAVAIGKGGMGTVCRARDTRLGREVAVKVSAARFSEREARAIASLNHPNICTLHSPDGKWIAYVSNETGRDEVWVRAFSPGKLEVTGKWLVPKGCGNFPDWLDNGELTYTNPELKRMAVAVTPGPVFRPATPVELFPFPSGFTAGAGAPDGRLLVTVPTSKDTKEPLTVVLNWQTA